MKSYKIEGGNSTNGDIGFVCYLEAESPEQALEVFKDTVGWDNNELALTRSDGETVRVQVYFGVNNLSVTKHVEEEETVVGDDEL